MDYPHSLSCHRAVVALFAAALVAFALAVSVTSTAEAATTGPYPGYNMNGNYNGAGSISASTYDNRDVKPGYESFTIWSGNTMAYDSATSQTVKAKKTFKKLKGMSYNQKNNTLTLSNVKAAKYTLSVNGMGTGFKIKLKGKNTLAGIYCQAASKYSAKGDWTGKYYPSSVTIDGKGSLALNKTKYNGSAITISGEGTRSTLTITRNPTVKMWAYGTSNVINVSATTAPNVSKAVALNGALNQALIRSSVKVPGYTSYKWEPVVIAEASNATSTTVYSANGKLYRQTDYSNSEYTLERIDKVGTTSYYAPSGKTMKVETLPTNKKTAKVLSTDTSGATKLNKGAYYGVTSGSSYFDTNARQYYYSKWNIYKKVAKINGYTYVTVAKKSVKNLKNLPKGYTGSTESKRSDSYNYAIKNSDLTAARF